MHDGGVKLDISTFERGRDHARFIDNDHGAFWGSITKIAYHGSQHPLRAHTNRVEKIRESHAKPEFREAMSKTIKDLYPQIKQTNLDKYGVECFLQREEVLEINRKKWNSAEALERKQNTKLERKRRANDRKFAKREEERLLKISQGLLVGPASRRSKMQTSGHFHSIDGQPLLSIWQTHFVSAISYSYLCKLVNMHQPLTLVDTQSLVAQYSQMSNIETALSSNTLVERFNKFPFPKANFKPDFKVSDQLYVNVDGLYWHCSKVLDPLYHFNLRELANQSNIQILQFRADEIQYKRPIVDSMISVKAGRSTKVFARKLSIEEVEVAEARPFLESNHLMGFNGATHHIALRDDQNIQSMISINITSNKAKIVRFCGALNTTVIGGYSRLLKYCIKHFHLNQIETFVDLRYGSIDALTSMGFKHINTTLGWKWTDYDRTYNRLRCRANMDGRRLSEVEYAKELKWTKIYDAGQAKLIWTKDI